MYLKDLGSEEYDEEAGPALKRPAAGSSTDHGDDAEEALQPVKKKPAVQVGISKTVLKKPAAAGSSKGQVATTFQVVLKKPAAAVVGSSPCNDDADPADLDGFKDRLKSRKFMELFDSLPAEVQDAFNSVVV